MSRFAATGASILVDDAEDTLSHLTTLATRALGVPMAYLALLEGDRLVLAGATGLPPAVQAGGELPAQHSLSRLALERRESVLVGARSSQPSPTISVEMELLGAVAHAAVPLLMPDGEMVGTLCVADNVDHDWTVHEQDMLSDLAAATAIILRNRETIHATNELARLLQRMIEPIQGLMDHVRSLTALVSEDEDSRVRTFAALAAGRVHAVSALIGEADVTLRAAMAVPMGRMRTGNLVELVRVCLANAEAVTGSTGAHLHGQPAPLQVECDPLEMERSLTDLLVALLRYAGASGKIHLRVLPASDAGRLDVVMRGPMVPTGEVVRLVSRFQAGEGRVAASLRLVGDTVLATSGRIRARSSAAGTAFRILLPRAPHAEALAFGTSDQAKDGV